MGRRPTRFREKCCVDRVGSREEVLIAHTLSTIHHADKIIVMHKGQVRELGSHQQLLVQRGILYQA